MESYQVFYDTNGFLEKNRDLLHTDSIQLLSSCSCLLPQLFASNMLNQSQNPVSPLWRLGGADSQKQSVGMKFKVMTPIITAMPDWNRWWKQRKNEMYKYTSFTYFCITCMYNHECRHFLRKTVSLLTIFQAWMQFISLSKPILLYTLVLRWKIFDVSLANWLKNCFRLQHKFGLLKFCWDGILLVSYLPAWLIDSL